MQFPQAGEIFTGFYCFLCKTSMQYQSCWWNLLREHITMVPIAKTVTTTQNPSFSMLPSLAVMKSTNKLNPWYIAHVVCFWAAEDTHTHKHTHTPQTKKKYIYILLVASSYAHCHVGTYRNMQTIYFILGLTGDFFQAFGIYFHQIKQPFAITNFFRPLDVQGSSTKCFQWSAQVSYLLKQTFFKLWNTF